MEFKDRLKELRNEKGISAPLFAKRLGKAESTIRMWEIGKAKPDVDTLIKVALILQCSTDYLIGLTDIRSSDVNVQTVCDYTGLSEGSIKILRLRDQLNLGDVVKTINLLIEQTIPAPEFGYTFEGKAEADEGQEATKAYEEYEKECEEWLKNEYIDVLRSITNYLYTSSKDQMYLINKDHQMKPVNDSDHESSIFFYPPKSLNKVDINTSSPLRKMSQMKIIESVLLLDMQDKIRELKHKKVNINDKKDKKGR